MNFEINNENIEKSFSIVATDIMNNWILKTNEISYRICELEFYYKSDSHQDPYIHGHELQKQMGKWYFHGSGLDLTFGSEGISGSILIRAIYNLDEEKYIYGPLNTVTELLSNLPGIYGGDFSLQFEQDNKGKIKSEDKIKSIEAPRVGLSPEKDNKDKFCKKNYRFLVMPKNKHIGKESLMAEMAINGKSKEEIKKYWSR